MKAPPQWKKPSPWIEEKTENLMATERQREIKRRRKRREKRLKAKVREARKQKKKRA